MMHGHFIPNSTDYCTLIDTDLFQVDISFDIKPHWQLMPPLAKIALDKELIWDGRLEQTKSFEFARYLQKGDHVLEIEMYDKPALNCDQGLEISDLGIGRIHSRSFVWQGIYRPRYPEPWASEQREQGIILDPQLRNTDYLGWNGAWSLVFSCPVFSWIHRIENLGWVYD